MASGSKKCPKCGSTKILEILYGKFAMPTGNELKKFNKKYHFAGCVVDAKSPKWHCKNCGKEFGRQDS